MEILEYERRRNEHVLRRTLELRELLEMSPFSGIAVNNYILRQHFGVVPKPQCVAAATP
jgi:hypothetical protein